MGTTAGIPYKASEFPENVILVHIKLEYTKDVNQIDTQSSAIVINMLQSSRKPAKECLHESSFCKTGSSRRCSVVACGILGPAGFFHQIIHK